MTPTKTLLLVEDEALVRHDLKEGLVEAGFDVSDVAQGGKALSELEADPSRFNGLITDISLGRGPDGWDIARRARELIPISAVTARPIGHRKVSPQTVRDGPAHHGNIHAASRGRRA
jgi:DNA-binding response OmpR family regulator